MSATRMQPVAVAEGERSFAIAGSMRDTMIVTGDNNTVEMRLTAVGAVLAFVFRWDRPRRRRRRDRRPCPPRFEYHVDREVQVSTLLAVDRSSPAVNVYGPEQIGKTYVLVEALNRRECEMRDGTVYIADGSGKSADDLLHDVFNELYECRIRRRDLRIERRLSSRRVVLALEDVELSPSDAQRLMLGASRCRMLVTSRSRVLFDAKPVNLGGLAAEHGAAIAEQELGRRLAPRERQAAESIAMRLDGHPLALRQAFSRARDEGAGRSLDELEAMLVASPTAADRLAALSVPQLRAARILALCTDAALGDEHLCAIAGEEAAAAVAELEARHEAASHSPRHSLVGVLARELPQDDLAEETDRALEYFTSWSEAHAGDNDALMSEAGALLALLERAHATRRWAQVIRLGRAVESAYALGQRWQGWGRVLELVLDAARRSEDREAEGWARHQLGTRAYGLGRIDEARGTLHEALALRERIGDTAGAAATRQNLRVVAGRGALPYRLSHLPLGVVAIACALLIGAASVAGAEILSHDNNTKMPGDHGNTEPYPDDNDHSDGGGHTGERRVLIVRVRGDGVVLAHPSIRCAEPRCRTVLAVNRRVQLRARPHRGSEFARWSGACSGRSSCRLVMSTDTQVIALFKRVRDPRDVTVTVDGKGSVVSHPAGIACTANRQCHATFTRSRPLQFTAAAARGHRFAGWSGDCDGATPCVISGDSRNNAVAARFVADPEAITLSVDARGTGLGRITSQPSGIDCGELCTAAFARGRVILTAVAEPGSTFVGWNDRTCDAMTRDSCTMTLDRRRRVIAGFDTSSTPPPPPPDRPPPPPQEFPLTVNVDGGGLAEVSSTPMRVDSCHTHCEYAFPAGTDVRLRASPREGSVFDAWSRGCSETDECLLRMDGPRSVTASFAEGATLTIVNRAPDRGTVTSQPVGIACGLRCRYTFAVGTAVTLTASNDQDWTFGRWEGLEQECSQIPAPPPGPAPPQGSQQVQPRPVEPRRTYANPCKLELHSSREATVVFEAIPG